MLPIVAFPLLSVFAAGASAYSHSAGISEFSLNLNANLNTTGDSCDPTCAKFSFLENDCDDPHCGCTTAFLQAQGDCLLCQARPGNPSDAASVQLLLDAEMDQCHKDGIHIDFQLQLSSAAAAIVRKFNASSAELRRDQIAFLALQITGGHIGLVLILLHGVFSRRVHRDAILFNFCLTWIFSSIAFSLLLYRGSEGNTEVNSLGFVQPNMCLVQAALTSGAQVMTACSTMALIIQLWLGLRATVYGDMDIKLTRITSTSLLILPYVLFLALALPAVLIGQRYFTIKGSYFEMAIPTNFYCLVMDKHGFLPVLYGITLGLLVITVVFDGIILHILFRHWRAFRNANLEGSALSLSALLRVMAFSIYRIVVAVAYGTILRMPPKSKFLGEDVGSGDTLVVLFGVPRWVDMLQAATPLVAFLVLAANKDTIGALIFWKKKNLKRGQASSKE